MAVDFDRDLERDLHRILDPIAAAPVPARRTSASSNPVRKLLGGAGAALGLKALTGFAVAAMAAGATGAAITGSINPADWGRQARHQVTSVSNQHGTAVTDQQTTQAAPVNPSQSSKTDAGSTAGNPAGNPAGNASGGTEQPSGQATGAPKGVSLKVNAGLEPAPTDPGMNHGPMPLGPET